MERKPYPSETQERFIVRLPDGMRDRIADAAKAAGRSMNAEIVARLQASFDTQAVTGQTDLEDATRETKQAEEIAERVVERLEATKLTPLPMGGEYMEAIEKMLAAAHDRHRQWWIKEFGYDPDAPPVERMLSKVPAQSSNARKLPPSKKPWK